MTSLQRELVKKRLYNVIISRIGEHVYQASRDSSMWHNQKVRTHTYLKNKRCTTLLQFLGHSLKGCSDHSCWCTFAMHGESPRLCQNSSLWNKHLFGQEEEVVGYQIVMIVTNSTVFFFGTAFVQSAWCLGVFCNASMLQAGQGSHITHYIFFLFF